MIEVLWNLSDVSRKLLDAQDQKYRETAGLTQTICNLKSTSDFLVHIALIKTLLSLR